MYSSWLAKVMLAIAIAVMPLQGFAQTVVALVCEPHMAGHSTPHEEEHNHDSGDIVAHDHGSGVQSVSDSDGSTGGHTDNACSHFAVSGLPADVLSLTMPDFPVLAFTRDAFIYFTFLKLPQRPPLV